MTDFDKIRSYYSMFNENARLSADPSGQLEFMMTMKKLHRFLQPSSTILDLGGASGAYTFPLAKEGHTLYLADLSPALIQQAKDKLAVNPSPNIRSCDVVNALDLSGYPDGMFDAVLLFGPLYHLLAEEERQQCVREVHRVLRPGGQVFAAFIPRLSGAIAIVDRACFAPQQVNRENLRHVFRTGQFINNASTGFQEGYYPTSDEIVSLFGANGFEKTHLSSIRGFAYEKEKAVFSLQNEAVRSEVLALAEETCEDPAIIETCGHALYIGRKF